MAACDTDNHVLLFKHSVVDVQQAANAEEVDITIEVGTICYFACSGCQDGLPSSVGTSLVFSSLTRLSLFASPQMTVSALSLLK